MGIDLKTVDLESAEDVDEIIPQPQVAVSANEHRFSSIGAESKGLMLKLLEATDEAEPFGTRVFERLGLAYDHARWKEYDLYWVEGGEEALVEALRAWYRSYEMA